MDSVQYNVHIITLLTELLGFRTLSIVRFLNNIKKNNFLKLDMFPYSL
jgi:hypothetical protein